MKADRIRSHLVGLPSSDLVVAYGSGAFQQAGHTSFDGKMTDLLVFTSDRDRFVSELVSTRLVRSSCARGVDLFQPLVAFFAGVPLGRSEFEYKLGVVSTQVLFDCLSDWDNSFYIAGRLQKPTMVIQASSDSVSKRFTDSQSRNLSGALRAACIAMPPEIGESFSLSTLFESLVSLSYLGDVRVGVAENPQKIQNIVQGQMDLLYGMYHPHFDGVGITAEAGDILRLNVSRQELWNGLPAKFKKSAIQFADPRASLIATLSGINRRESAYQAVSGVFTSGPSVSSRYLFRKLLKRFR
jgi:hypothetical protein